MKKQKFNDLRMNDPAIATNFNMADDIRLNHHFILSNSVQNKNTKNIGKMSKKRIERFIELPVMADYLCLYNL